MESGLEPSADNVVTVIGGRPFTFGHLTTLLEGYRAAIRTEGGGGLLVRFFVDEAETIPIPFMPPTIALCGMSYVPAAELVLSVHHDPHEGAGKFTAIAALPDGSGLVVVGENDGPFTLLDDGFQSIPLMHLIMTKLAYGRPLSADGFRTTIADWLLRVVVNDSVLQLIEHDSKGSGVDDVLRDRFGRALLAITSAADPAVAMRPVPAGWPALSEAASRVGDLDWDDLDSARFGAARGFDPNAAKWWTPTGIAGLELMLTPSLGENLDKLASRNPARAAALRESVDRFALHLEPKRGIGWARWQVDDPTQLVELIRTVLAEPGFTSTYAVVGYRRNGARLRPGIRLMSAVDHAGQLQFDPTTLDSLGAADGAVLICTAGQRWWARTLNRENEIGSLASEIGVVPATPHEDEMSIVLRRLLTGEAAPPGWRPYDWLGQRILYGLARTLESEGRLDGERSAEPASTEKPPAGPPDLSTLESPMSYWIDLALFELVRKHLKPFMDALGSGPLLHAVPDQGIPMDELFPLCGNTIQLFRKLPWSRFRTEPLAEAWEVELADAQWAGAGGMAMRQTFRMPDITESLRRCSFVLDRSKESDVARAHLMRRVKEVFGDDVPVLWSLGSPKG